MKDFLKKKVLIPFIVLIFMLSFATAGCSSAIKQANADSTPAFSEEPVGTPTAAAAAGASEKGISYVTVDINPSIQLTLKDGLVTEAKAFNDDGSEIILNHSVINLTADEAMDVLINAFAQGGYFGLDITGAALVITVSGDDENVAVTDLQQKVQTSLTNLGLQCEVLAKTVEEGTIEEAAKYGLSAGRYLLLKYLAEQENITLETAIEKYATMRMGDLLKLIDDPDKAFEDITGGLTPEQQQALMEAINAYKTAMKTAQQVFLQTKSDAQKYFQSAKKDAQNAFKKNKDHQAWEDTKTALQREFKQKQAAALEAYQKAKEQARAQFMAAIAGLGLTERAIGRYLAWDFDKNWDFDFNWKTPDVNEEADKDNDEQGRGDKNKGNDEQDQDNEDKETQNNNDNNRSKKNEADENNQD